MANYSPGYDLTGGGGGGGGFEGVFEIDFTAMTPTVITSTGVTVIDGVSLNVTALNGTSITIDATGMHAVGGSGVISVTIDLDSVQSGIDLSGEQMIGLVVDSTDTGFAHITLIGDSADDCFGLWRQTGGTLQAVRYISGSFSGNGASASTPREGQSAIWTPGCVVTRHQSAAPVAADGPLDIGTPGAIEDPASSWAPFTASGGVLIWNANGGSSRTTAIRKFKGYRVPLGV